MEFFVETKASFQMVAVFVVVLLFGFCLTSIDAYDALDPSGNITIKWDVMTWTPDGYVAVVTIYNFQKYRHIESPGWELSWEWAKDEVIWEMMGGQAREQGDCSNFTANIPHSCKTNPTIVDLLPGTPFNKQVANCCRGGVISSWVQDPANAISSFQVSVGRAGTTNKTVSLPQNFTLHSPGPGYTCGRPNIVDPTVFPTPDKRRFTQALMTWSLACTYSQFLAQKMPTCCLSISSFYNDMIVDCPTCSCGCPNAAQPGGNCIPPNTPHIASVVSSSNNNLTPTVQCTNHMCPVRVHWHLKLNYREYWRVKITVQNFDYAANYTNWNLVVQHPGFDNVTQIFSFNYQPLTPYGSINDTAMLWGVKFYNDLLKQNGPSGNVQSEVLFGKDKTSFSFDKGWGFPRRVYFNGENCVMPPPDAYPFLPNHGPHTSFSMLHFVTNIMATFVVLFVQTCLY